MLCHCVWFNSLPSALERCIKVVSQGTLAYVLAAPDKIILLLLDEYICSRSCKVFDLLMGRCATEWCWIGLVMFGIDIFVTAATNMHFVYME